MKRVQCFDAACEIVFGTEGPNMARQLALLFKVNEFKQDAQFGAAWPKGMEFVTFSCYYVETASALSVISSFCETIRSCFVMAEVEILADEWREDRFDLTNLSHQEVLDLWRGTRAKARWQLEADKWVSGEVIRDRRILKHNVDRELYKILNGAESEHINLEGPSNQTDGACPMVCSRTAGWDQVHSSWSISFGSKKTRQPRSI